jgi:hypothetical protein
MNDDRDFDGPDIIQSRADGYRVFIENLHWICDVDFGGN